jgi:general stress protein CsbA
MAIGIFFALWVSYVISVAFVGCGIIFCQWTVEIVFRILMITALPMAIGFLIIRYDEKRRGADKTKARQKSG